MILLNEKLWFPPIEEAMEDGLLAIGGDVNPERLKLAYSKGIFPWFDGDIPLWWSPDPRFVLFPGNLVIAKSMRPILRNLKYQFRLNTAFEEVMRNCMQINRKAQDGTWISEALIQSFLILHQQGLAYSAECWENNELIGGLYGIRMGNLFFGESMFAKKSNASKYAFIHYVQQLEKEGVVLIDCQVYTEHLESLGAEMISREAFLRWLA
ncbi:MAG: leucyl/phenylalanyl-tRNA--protein transferase [Chitinophagaceae bacterium]|nr:leucyl/phenylalanyl-tRNA--protein transferase [Chitinophagaceae bacterium]